MILVLDDDSLVSKLIDDLIRQAGRVCEITGDIDEAYRRVMERGGEFSLAILDLRIGDDSTAGLRLAGMIRKIPDPEKANLPIVLTTGAHDFERHAQLASEMKISALLTKPFNPDEFYATIERYSRGRMAAPV